MRRSSLSDHYEVPEGWHRHAVSDDEEDPDFDPWFNLIQELALRLVMVMMMMILIMVMKY